jgi:internalin A
MRTLAITTVVLSLLTLGCVFGCGAARRNTPETAPSSSDQSEKEAIRRIRNRGGGVEVDEKGLDRPSIAVSLMGPKFGDADLSLLTELTCLEKLCLKASSVTDRGLAEIAELPTKGHIRALFLNGTKVTDAGLVHLHEFPNLELLNLGPTRTGDPGMRHVGRLKNLRILDVSGTKVTDQGLRRLLGMKSLKQIYLFALDGVTSAGVSDLKTHLPGLAVHR